MTHTTCRMTAKNRDQLRNPTLGNRVLATFTFTSKGKEGRKDGREMKGRVGDLHHRQWGEESCFMVLRGMDGCPG